MSKKVIMSRFEGISKKVIMLPVYILISFRGPDNLDLSRIRA